MKPLIKLLIAAIFVSHAFAQDKQSHGFLNVVNLVPSDTVIHITLADKKLVPSGLKAAEQTGWFMIPAGSARLEIGHADYQKHRAPLTIHDGVSQIIVIFLRYADPPKTAKADETPALQITSLPAYASKGHGIKAVSLIQNTQAFQFSKYQLELEYLNISEMPNWTGNTFEIKHNGKKIGEIDRSRERASHYLLLATNGKDKYLTTLVNADVQRLPPWMEN